MVAAAENCPSLFSPDDSGWGAALCAVVSTLQPASIARLAIPAVAVAENIATLIALAAGPESQARCPAAACFAACHFA